MKKIFTLILSLVLVQIFAQLPSEVEGWGLKFQDEFEGNHLDPSNWKLGGHYLGIPGLAGVEGKNINVENGYLTIKAHKKPTIYAGKRTDYSTGEISTFKKYRTKYGYFEARIKYDAIRGCWPAFWMMPDRGDYGIDSKNYESYINFDLSPVTNSSVSTAILKLKITDMDPNGLKNVTIHKLLDTNWDESTINWNNKPDYDPTWIMQLTGSDDASLVSLLVKGNYIEIDITDYINQQLAGDKKVGFALLDNFMRIKAVQFGSKEADEEADRPRLELDGEIIYASDDAYVKGGTSANMNFGSKKYLLVTEEWKRTSSTSNGGMEYDIMEALGVWGPDKIQHALHWDDYESDHKTKSSNKKIVAPSADDFHVYGMLWDFGKVSFYIDGIKSWEYENSRVGTIPSYMLLSFQMGGWDGNGSPSDASLPANMVIDYVRVYDKNIISVSNTIPKSQLEINISPNPIRNNDLNITVTGGDEYSDVKYKIIDILGNVLYHGADKYDNQGNLSLNISMNNIQLKAGIYFLSIGHTTTKFEKI